VKALIKREMRFATVNVAILSQHTEDRGVGIVVIKTPLTLIVPLHLITTLDEDPTARLKVNGDAYEKATVLTTHELERDELALIRVRGRRRSTFGSIRIPRREVRLKPGQTIALGGASSSKEPLRMGTIVEVRERSQGTTVVTDIEIEPGASGSALIINRQLVAVCQGMLPNGKGGVAIAMPLSTSALERLWRLRRQSFLRRGLPLALSLLAAVGLALIGLLASIGPSTRALSLPAGYHAESNVPEPQMTQTPLVVDLDRPMFLAEARHGDGLEAAEAAECITTRGGADGLVYGLAWDQQGPLDFTLSIAKGPLDFLSSLRLTLSASQDMEADLSLGAAGTACGSIVRDSRRIEERIRLTPEPATFTLVPGGEAAGTWCEQKTIVGIWSVEVRPRAESGIIWVHDAEITCDVPPLQMSHVLPMWLRLFDASITRDWVVHPEGELDVRIHPGAQQSIAVMTWDVPAQSAVDVSYDLPEPVGEGAEAIELTLSSPNPLDLRVSAAWEGEYCDWSFHTLEAAWVLRVDAEPRRYVIPYSAFSKDFFKRCPGPHEEPDWERLVCLTFFPEASTGELHFHEFSLISEAPEGD